MATDGAGRDPLHEQAYRVVAALADGEPVDPDSLKLALEQSAVRDYLVDLMALRQAVVTVAATSDVRWRERQSIWSRRGWLTAAAAMLLSLTAGYFAGQRTGAQSVSLSTVETVVAVGAAMPAPHPTRVVSLRPGVNWIEKAGEQ
jgi:hypothetical protein